MNKPRVAILTTFTDLDPSYSLVSVAIAQCRMLDQGGYDHAIVVEDHFNTKWADRRSEILPDSTEILPVARSLRNVDYRRDEGPQDDFDDLVEKHEDAYERLIEDWKPDVVITHDIIFQSWFLAQNQALRNVAERHAGSVRWLHWIHSRPDANRTGVYPSKLRYEEFPGSIMVTLNHTNVQDVVNHYQIPRSRVGVCTNPRDIRHVRRFADESCKVIRDWNLLDHDVLQVYPFSTPRWREKGVVYLAALFGAFKEVLGKNRVGAAKLVLINAHANSEEDKKHIAQMKMVLKKFGLIAGVDYFLTSEYENGIWSHSTPGRVVQELMQISNFFAFPTESENCSLIQAEAACSGAYVVLNQNVPSLAEFAPKNHHYLAFHDHDPNKQAWFYEAAGREILQSMSTERALQQRTLAITRTYNEDAIFRTQFEPLLYGMMIR